MGLLDAGSGGYTTEPTSRRWWPVRGFLFRDLPPVPGQSVNFLLV